MQVQHLSPSQGFVQGGVLAHIAQAPARSALARMIIGPSFPVINPVVQAECDHGGRVRQFSGKPILTRVMDKEP